jgi:predicted glycogen debranching enzyme
MSTPASMIRPDLLAAEWIETDGLGGFSSGTVSGERTRRYHALLLVATQPPTGRMVLVNGFDAWIERDGVRYALTRQRYAPGVQHPDGDRRIERFNSEPWPKWIYRLEDGTRVEQQIAVEHGRPRVSVSWKLLDRAPGARLIVRPLLSVRDYHSLHHENPGFRFDAHISGERVVWQPYESAPAIHSRSNGEYRHDPVWYRQFLYLEERDRGLDCIEDLASPGQIVWDLSAAEARWMLEAHRSDEGAKDDVVPVQADGTALRVAEDARRQALGSVLDRAADSYLVSRGSGKTIVAGYPWFTDWGRDTLIAMRGLCLATGRLTEARDILLKWSGAVSEGMLPNRFPDHRELPEFNSVDASLWYVIVLHEFLEAAGAAGLAIEKRERGQLDEAADLILTAYAKGTRYRIHLDKDGLLAAGEPGVQLTWMDAKVGDRVVTPRIGKPVEVQALWLNALNIAARRDTRWRPLLERGLTSFQDRFWDSGRAQLHDVVDADHEPGAVESACRPNQIFAVGGLPMPLLTGDRARAVVDMVERRLSTPLGLRSLAPGEPGYAARYEGGVRERDGAYHQGTVWPWLMGPFIEAWVRVRRGTAAAKQEARSRFLQGLLDHLADAGLGHISEIADADPPHAPRGCPFQAWSLGELLRLDRVVLRARSASRPKVHPSTQPA